MSMVAGYAPALESSCRRSRLEPDYGPSRHPVITVPGAVAVTGRAKPAVASAIAQMEAAGILARPAESARNRTWDADGLLDIIVGLKAGVSSASRT
jgi:hypothetical protein